MLFPLCSIIYIFLILDLSQFSTNSYTHHSFGNMSSIETELWNIFTYYTLHSNPRDPSKINGTVMYKFCRDVMVVDASMTEKPITQAELHIIFTSELKHRKKVSSCLANF